LLNNDTLIQLGSVSCMVGKFSDEPEVGLCGSKVIYASMPDKVQALGGAKFNRVFGRAVHIGSMSNVKDVVNETLVNSYLDYILGASTMVYKNFLTTVGKMEEKYFL